MAQFKQKCMICKKNWVLATGRTRFVVCYDCQKRDMDKKVKDPVLEKMFNIPEEFYKENAFLRDIKVKVTKWGNELTPKQIEAFKKVVKDLKEKKKE